MPAWALQLSTPNLDAVVPLWPIPRVEILQQEADLWLRGPDADEATTRLLASIPNVGRYEVLATGELLRRDLRVPQGYLPQGAWQPLKKFLTLAFPRASLPARAPTPITVQLFPTPDVREPDVLLTTLEAWSQYTGVAPAIRLRCCRFAVAADQRVIVQSTPLPPISGTRAVAQAGIVVPCGWGWQPAVEASLLARAWGIPSGDLWLLWPDRPIERISHENLVAASRSAVRQTREALGHE